MTLFKQFNISSFSKKFAVTKKLKIILIAIVVIGVFLIVRSYIYSPEKDSLRIKTYDIKSFVEPVLEKSEWRYLDILKQDSKKGIVLSDQQNYSESFKEISSNFNNNLNEHLGFKPMKSFSDFNVYLCSVYFHKDDISNVISLVKHKVKGIILTTKYNNNLYYLMIGPYSNKEKLEDWKNKAKLNCSRRKI